MASESSQHEWVFDITYTLDDYREAAMMRRPHALTAKPTRGIIGWMLAAALGLTLLLLAAWNANTPGLSLSQRLARVANTTLPMAPWPLLFVLIFGYSAFATKGLGRAKIFLLVFGFAVVLAGAGLVVLKRSEPSMIPAEPSLSGWAAAGFLLMLWLALLRQVASAAPYRRIWDGQSNLHSPRMMTADPDGLTVRDTLIFQSYQWPAFSRFAESRSVFVLYLSEYSFHMVPKRALGDDKQIAAFRWFLQQHISVPTRAFPVVPYAAIAHPSPPPLPTSAPSETRSEL